MLPLSKTKKIFWSSLFLAIFLVALYFGLVLLHQKVSQTEKELSNKLAVAQEIERERFSLDLLLEETEEKRSQLNSYFVSAEDPAQFVSLLESAANDAGVSLEIQSLSISPVSEEDAANILENLDITLTAQGSWNRVVHYTSLIESLPYVVDVDQVRLNYEATTDQQPAFWRSNIRFSVLKIRDN